MLRQSKVCGTLTSYSQNNHKRHRHDPLPPCPHDGRTQTDVARKAGLSRITVTLLYKESAQKVDLEALNNCVSYLTAALVNC